MTSFTSESATEPAGPANSRPRGRFCSPSSVLRRPSTPLHPPTPTRAPLRIAHRTVAAHNQSVPNIDPDAVLRLLRRHYSGTLIVDDRSTPVRFIIDPARPRLVLALEPTALHAEQAVLFVPFEDETAAQLLLEMSPLDPDGDAGTDRWQAYHGRPGGLKWAQANVDLVKLAGAVLEGADVLGPGELAGEQSRLCRLVNEHDGGPAALCRAAGHKSAPDARCVGVDELGADVRSGITLVRVEFPESTRFAHATEQALRAAMGTGR